MTQSWYDQFQFSKARRKEAASKLRKVVTGEEPDEGLLPLEEVQDRLGLFGQHYGGLKAIPVENIVGSVGRSAEFDEAFRPKTDRLKARWEQLENAYPFGDFPPIEVYQVGDAYFVIDGHHRVGIARQRDIQFLDAEITVLTTDQEFDADTDLGEVIMLQQRKRFFDRSGLAKVRPDANIRFTRPQGYNQLLERVKIHGCHEMQAREKVMSMEEIAADWYDRVYEPRIKRIKEVGLPELLPDVTESDIFLMVHERLHSMFPTRGMATFDDAAANTADEERRRVDSPIGRVKRAADSFGGGPDET